MVFKPGHTPWNKGIHRSEEHRRKISDSNKRRRISESLAIFFKQRKFERRRNALKEFYRTHTVWNKGRPRSPDIRERIRKGCLNCPIGMRTNPTQAQE